MSKTLAIVTGSILAIVLGIGISAYAADQQQSQDQTETQAQEQDQTSEACQQCHKERQQQRLDNAVEDGTITQEEADEIQAWWDAEPEAMEKLKGDGFGPKGRFGERDGNCQTSTDSNTTSS